LNFVTRLPVERRFVLKLTDQSASASHDSAKNETDALWRANRSGKMPAFSRGAIAGSIVALTAIIALSANANAQTTHRTVHHRIHTAAPWRPVASPLAPGVELRASTSASEGSENHYFSDTVAAGHTDLMDNMFRYGQSPTTQYNSAEPLFRF
jgi:hypothetical protein